MAAGATGACTVVAANSEDAASATPATSNRERAVGFIPGFLHEPFPIECLALENELRKPPSCARPRGPPHPEGTGEDRPAEGAPFRRGAAGGGHRGRRVFFRGKVPAAPHRRGRYGLLADRGPGHHGSLRDRLHR